MGYLWSCVSFVLMNLILEATDGLSVPYNTCVIGAGFSGLGAARHLKEYGLDFKMFEATRHVGGTWRFDPHVGVDEDGTPVLTHMYKYLRTNTPRQTMEYAGFPFPPDTPTYPAATCYHSYMKTFAKKFDIIKHIQFQSLVTSVKWAGDHWDVTYTRTIAPMTNQTEECGFLIIATGEYRKIKMPVFKGQDMFKGTIIHSHDYKEPEVYKDRRVLILGAGASGLDLAIHLTNHTAKLVHSHHLAYNQPYYGSKYVKKPDILAFTSNGVIFEDQTFEEIDDAIFCTGYDYDHSFLDKNCGVTASSKFILPLYQHTVNIIHPTMVFVGFPKKVINRVLDAQGQYAAALAAGKFKLPPQETMLKTWLDHVYGLQKKKMTMMDVNVIGEEMNQYFANLTQEAGVHHVPPVIANIRDFNQKNRLEDILNYRDYDYQIIDNENFERRYNKRDPLPCPFEEE